MAQDFQLECDTQFFPHTVASRTELIPKGQTHRGHPATSLLCGVQLEPGQEPTQMQLPATNFSSLFYLP